MLVSASLAMGLWLIATSREGPLVTVPAPQAALKRETEEQRQARHATVAATRWWNFTVHGFILPVLAEIGSDSTLNVLETILVPTKPGWALLLPYLEQWLFWEQLGFRYCFSVAHFSPVTAVTDLAGPAGEACPS